MSTQFNYPVINGVAVISLESPPVNSLSGALRVHLDRQIRDAVSRSEVKAVILIGANNVFCGGAEIREFNTPAQRMQPTMPQLIEGLDGIDKILIAAIDGFALGAGLELVLACHYRVATSRVKLGLPEVRFGFPPGAGGTQRLPRLIALPKAAEMILSGAPLAAKEAHAAGLVDYLVAGDLLRGALAFTESLFAQGSGVRRTRDQSVLMEGVGETFLDDLRRKVAELEPGNVAKLAVIDCLAATALPFAEGLKFEREKFLQMLESPESKALRYVFFAERQAAKLADLPVGIVERPIRRAAVIGAGTMGTGIAICFASAGIPVSLIDTNAQILERAQLTVGAYYSASVAKGRLDEEGKTRALGMVTRGQDMAACADADIIVEAVFESMEIKLEIFRQLDSIAKPSAILATNTSMLDVNLIAAATGRPQDVLGLHFFSPAHVMRLLEVVNCNNTAPDVLLTAVRLAMTLGKAPVVSRVCDGFIGNRMLQRYGQQSLFLLDQGCSPKQVDQALQSWGMAMGPFAVGDLSGLDIGWSIRKRRYVENPDMVYSHIADRICEAGRLGQKTGKGWYRYEAGSRKPLWDAETDSILTAYRQEFSIPQHHFTDKDIIERLIFSLVNEGAAILEQGVAQRASDIDVVYTTGYGFPTKRGGPMYYANCIGLDHVVLRIREFQRGYQGDQWKLSPLLERLAQQGKTFS
jgi:3-hydroxyacyl-CoA dehydrogenase